jgi:hypothetical protein
MSTIEYKKPPHFELSEGEFEANVFNQQWDINVVMFYDIGSPSFQPRFLFKATYKQGSVVVAANAKTFICGIPGDAKVTITIDPAIASWCRWSQVYLPVTAKMSEPDIGASTHSNGEARFKVKKRAEANLRYHHLYLNIELLVGTTVEGRELWVDYNYDPDVINPRPPGRIATDETLVSMHPLMRGLDDDVIVPAPPPLGQAKPLIEVIFS